MVAPIYVAAANAGNLLTTGTSLAAGKNVGVPLDASNLFEAQVSCFMQTGGTVASTAGVKWEFYHYYATTTTTGSLTAGFTSVPVTSGAKIQNGQKIIIYDATNLGELVTVTSGGGTTTLTTSAGNTNHTNPATVYIVEQTASIVVTPGPSSGTTYSGNTVYSKTVYAPTSKYFVLATNLDVTNAVTLEATNDNITGIQ
jgi:hypothetical protein